MSKDLLTIREYEYKGIKILVKIDRLKGMASLVDRDASGQYFDKEWLFVDRTVGYMRSWNTILEAMQHAINAAIADLEGFEKDQAEEKAEARAILYKQVDEAINGRSS